MAVICDSCEERVGPGRREIYLTEDLDDSRGVDLCAACYQGLFGSRDQRIEAETARADSYKVDALQVPPMQAHLAQLERERDAEKARADRLLPAHVDAHIRQQDERIAALEGRLAVALGCIADGIDEHWVTYPENAKRLAAARGEGGA